MVISALPSSMCHPLDGRASQRLLGLTGLTGFTGVRLWGPWGSLATRALQAMQGRASGASRRDARDARGGSWGLLRMGWGPFPSPYPHAEPPPRWPGVAHEPQLPMQSNCPQLTERVRLWGPWGQSPHAKQLPPTR